MVLTAWAPVAVALTATLSAHAHLRAGPSIEYPSVVMMPAGAVVEVFGCEQGYNWCDVQLGADRGWVDGVFLQAAAPGGPVVVSSSAGVLGIPTVSFVFNSYWGNYYSGRPWYGRRDFYYKYWNRYPHGRPPPLYRPPPSVRPPPVVRPRPPGNVRPPGGERPPAGNGKPPGNGRPPGNDKPPGSDKPSDGSQPPRGSE
ncbi:MAG TPA: SH3 domain-containing protein [Steroidobacteraceae bacterium]|nr:SH3 domain-containing protein [Steroidobacteraceae bacterium]